jgi:hypothetical protein
MTNPPSAADARLALADVDRSVCLCDAGQSDYAAVTAVHSDGSTSLVLAHYALCIACLREYAVPESRFCASCVIAHDAATLRADPSAEIPKRPTPTED